MAESKRQKFRKYHNRLVRLCQAIAAINVDAKLFNKYAPKRVRDLDDNQKIRWQLEDMIRILMRKNGDFPNKYRQ